MQHSAFAFVLLNRVKKKKNSLHCSLWLKIWNLFDTDYDDGDKMADDVSFICNVDFEYLIGIHNRNYELQK